MGDAEKTSTAGEAPKKQKIMQFSHWARPKSTLYEYNYDYGSYYYRPMIDYLNVRSKGGYAEVVKPMFLGGKGSKIIHGQEPSNSILPCEQRHCFVTKHSEQQFSLCGSL